MRNEMLGDLIKENTEEIKRKNAAGEKLSAKNLIILICQLGMLVCSIYVSYLIISLLLSI